MKKYVVLSLLLTSACASILQGSKQEINVRVEPETAANCSVKNGESNQEFSAPSKITITRSYYPLEITCSANGQTGTAKILSDVAGIGYAGAVVGVGVGAGVDTYTGAAFEYPTEIVVKLGETTILGKTSMNSNVEQ